MSHAEDRAALAALRQALRGASGLFLVTFSDFARPGAEAQLGTAMVSAAAAARVPLLAFSSGMRTNQPFLDAKADVEAAARALPPGTFAAAHYLHTGFFYENLVVKGGQPRLQCSAASDVTMSTATASSTSTATSASSGDGLHITFTSPFPEDTPVVMHAASDVGRSAARALWAGAVPAGRDVVRLVGSKTTGRRYAETVQQLAQQRNWNVTTEYLAVPVAALRQAVPGKMT